MKTTVKNTTEILLLIIFLFYGLRTNAQSMSDLSKLSKDSENKFFQEIKSLIYDVQPTIYFEDNTKKNLEEKNPLKIVTDGVSLNEVFNANYNKSTVQLIEIRIDNTEDFSTRINVDNYLNLFPDLKYMFFVFTYDCCAQFSIKEDCLKKKIVEMLNTNSNNNLQMVYSLSVNE